MLVVIIERAATKATDAKEDNEAFKQFEIDRNSDSKLVETKCLLGNCASYQSSSVRAHRDLLWFTIQKFSGLPQSNWSFHLSVRQISFLTSSSIPFPCLFSLQNRSVKLLLLLDSSVFGSWYNLGPIFAQSDAHTFYALGLIIWSWWYLACSSSWFFFSSATRRSLWQLMRSWRQILSLTLNF